MNLSISRNRRAVAAAFALSCVFPAQAGVIDLTDGVFVPGSVVYDFTGPIIEFAEQVDGVTFTFAASSQFREVGPWSDGTDPAPYSLAFGGAGLNTAHFTITADTTVELVSLLWVGYGTPLQPAVFDILDGLGNVVSSGNAPSSQSLSLTAANAAVDPFVGGPVLLNAGETYTFYTTNFSATTQSNLFELTFQTVGTTTPVPSAGVFALLLSGFGLLGVAARRRREGRGSARETAEG